MFAMKCEGFANVAILGITENSGEVIRSPRFASSNAGEL
jgi:hypothetical protein